jgi:hypothetical protein
VLIDLSRRPVRLTFEECPTVVVIRTLRLHTKAGGLLHHESQDPTVRKIFSLDPAARRARGNDEEYIETVLAPPIVHKEQPDHTRWGPTALPLRMARSTTYAAQHVPQRNGRVPHSNGITHLYCITGYADQITKVSGIWRINLVFDQGPKGTWLLTLLDETNGVPLLTVNVPTQIEVQPLFTVKTPLQRFLLSQASEAQDTFWAVLREEEP